MIDFIVDSIEVGVTEPSGFNLIIGIVVDVERSFDPYVGREGNRSLGTAGSDAFAK